MQNEDWYVITTLVINILTAIGTVGAVIVSLWFAYKSSRKEYNLLEITWVSLSVSEGDDGWRLFLMISVNNYIDKDIEYAAHCWFKCCNENVGISFSWIEDWNDNPKIPGQCRQYIIRFDRKYNKVDTKMMHDIDILMKKFNFVADFTTNIGNIRLRFPHKKFKKDLKDLQKWKKRHYK